MLNLDWGTWRVANFRGSPQLALSGSPEMSTARA
jgi:hypothetical protein